MLSGVLIFNQKGENLIFRAFRNDCRPRLADVFRIQVISNAQVRSPILTLGSTTFSHVKHENIYLVAITKSNANAALVFEFLYRLIQLGRGYFGKFDEEAVKNNFVLVYELLDGNPPPFMETCVAYTDTHPEIIDFGYPQNTETDTLKMYITTEGVKSEARPEDTSKITMQATGALSWRKADVKYRKNEAFVDVIEDVNLLMSATGAVLRADVTGQIVMRAYLSGTPECKFGLNDRLLLDNDGLLSLPSGNKMGTKATKAAAGSVTLEDCQFHQCVKLGKFDSDRIISFVPPDGEFELMRYRATENVNLPFKIHAIVNEVGRSKVEYSIGVKANFGSKLFATNVVIKIPTPLNTAKITERCTQGKAKYEPSENSIVWKIGRFTGQSEYVLSAEAILTSMTNQRAWSRPPLSMNFSLLMFTSSGLLVRYLKVFEKSNYSSVKWVRYMTRAGSYEIRYDSLRSALRAQGIHTNGLVQQILDRFLLQRHVRAGAFSAFGSPEQKGRVGMHSHI
jgi:AP-2 complex subunit mu-1